VERRDRLANVGLLALAALSWLAVGFLFTNRSPEGDLAVRLLGAGLVGLAAGITTTPLAWLVGFARHGRIAYHGDWVRAARRGMWVGLVVALLVALRTQHALSLPVAVFVVFMVVFVEVSLSVQR
jgi:hypothetical protein